MVHPAAPTSADSPRAEPRTHLPQVTLCAVDTRSPALALRALAHSLCGLATGRALLLCDKRVELSALPECLRERASEVEQVSIAPLASAQAYSDFVLRELHLHIHTSHALIAQWDGFVCKAEAWREEFLHFDYIGAPWAKAPPGQDVGNGGFCLRSRALMEAVSGLPNLHHPEDVCIARTHRATLEDQFGFRFAPAEVAALFAFENEVPARATTFGFHGMRNLHRALGAQNAHEWFSQLPASTFAGRDAFKTARDLIQDGHNDLARLVLERRSAAGARDWKTRMLSWRLAMRRRTD